MRITPKIRYAYIVGNSGQYLQARTVEFGQRTVWLMTIYKSDAKKFNSIQAAREYSGKMGGSRILRYDRLYGRIEDVEEMIKRGPERIWKESREAFI